MNNLSFRFGLCCIHNGLKSQGLSFKTMTWKKFSSMNRTEAIKELSSRYESNLYLVYQILLKCAEQGWTYRVSSDIFPLMTHPEAHIVWEELPNIHRLEKLFNLCEVAILTLNVRTSCHPDQFNVLASENEQSVKQTISELNHHGWFMTKLGCDKNYLSPINIHINRSNGDAQSIADSFAFNMEKLNEDVRSRLVVENEDKGVWNVDRMISVFYPTVHIPITFDYLHHECNNNGMSEEAAFHSCFDTWTCRPLFHYCESLPNQPNKRKHADFPTSIPNTYGKELDLDFEFKGKDDAIFAAKEILQKV